MTRDQRASSRSRKLGLVVAAAIVVLAGVVAILVMTGGVDDAGRSSGATPGAGDTTSLQRVMRQDLSSQTQVSATLGYAGTYVIVNYAVGSAMSSSSTQLTGS